MWPVPQGSPPRATRLGSWLGLDPQRAPSNSSWNRNPESKPSYITSVPELSPTLALALTLILILILILKELVLSESRHLNDIAGIGDCPALVSLNCDGCVQLADVSSLGSKNTSLTDCDFRGTSVEVPLHLAPGFVPSARGP